MPSLSRRRYYRSSSFKMAVLFALLLGIASILLGSFIYDFGARNFIRETEALIDREIQHTLSLVDASLFLTWGFWGSAPATLASGGEGDGESKGHGNPPSKHRP